MAVDVTVSDSGGEASTDGPKMSRAAAQPSARPWPPDLQGTSEAMRRARELVTSAAARDGGVLLVADRGFDLEAVAREIHARASATSAPFVAVECAAPDGAAVEQLLFGRAGARRGARPASPAVLETIGGSSALAEARGGTLVLMSVTDLAASAQARLARVLRDREVRLEASSRVVRLGVRVVACAGPTLDDDVTEGRFRPELLRRLGGVRIEIPALGRRREDIAPIARQLLRDASESAGGGARTFTQATLALLAALPWEGNVAELRKVIEGLVPRNPSAIRVEDVLAEVRLVGRAGVLGPQASLREARRQFEREYISAVLRHYDGRMGPAARVLGIQRTNLYRKARQLGIPRRKAAE
jgi:two-component system nitrogen regulation response regulator NtrX